MVLSKRNVNGDRGATQPGPAQHGLHRDSAPSALPAHTFSLARHTSSHGARNTHLRLAAGALRICSTRGTVRSHKHRPKHYVYDRARERLCATFARFDFLMDSCSWTLQPWAVEGACDAARAWPSCRRAGGAAGRVCLLCAAVSCDVAWCAVCPPIFSEEPRSVLEERHGLRAVLHRD